MRKVSRSKKSLYTVFKIISFVISVYVIAGCNFVKTEKAEKSETSYGFATFVLQWNNLISGYTLPQTICYCFYPVGGGPMIQTEGDADSAKIALPAGTYRLLLFNSDVENIRFRNMNGFDLAEVNFPVASEYIKRNLSPLYGYSIDEITIHPGQNIDFNVSPYSLVKHINLDVKITGKSLVESCKASLSGIAPTLNFSTRSSADSCECVTIPFSLETSPGGFKRDLLIWNISSELKTKGCSTSNVLNFDFTLNDGSTASAAIDLGTMLSEYSQQYMTIKVDASIKKNPSPSVSINSWNVQPVKTKEENEL